MLIEQKRKKRKEIIDKLIGKFNYEMSIHRNNKHEDSMSNRKSISQMKNYLDPTKMDISHKEWYKMLMHSDLAFMSNQQFKMIIKIERVLTPVSRDLQFIHGFYQFSREEIEDTLQSSDKDLYLQFRDKKITYDQLKARIAERQGIATYKVYDDIKCLLNPALLKRLDQIKARQDQIMA